ncbi:MAG: two pore domain potassium channel family protein [Gammaproteobacteria bacterium]|nr:two pore domain potassium channel family protein [Gammaproteobacteria bacterium]
MEEIQDADRHDRPGTYEQQYGAAIVGSQPPGLAECTYFSFSNHSSLGYGDLVLSGPFRFMAGMEALTGLVLIGWTASFMYLHMRRI